MVFPDGEEYNDRPFLFTHMSRERNWGQMKVIDAHVHLYPDKIAGKVTASLGAKFGNAPSFVATVEGCRSRDASAGVALSINLPVATAPGQVPHTNAWAHAVNESERAHPSGPSVLSLASLHPDCVDKSALVAQIAAAGFSGIKFHPEYQQFRFNDPKMEEIWAAMAECGLVAYLHAGGERVFKPPYHSTPREIADLQRRFPSLAIVAAHLGGFGMWDESEAVLCGSTVNLDLSHTFGWMDEAQILRMIRKHGANRILFGTDAPWQDPGTVLQAFLRLPLTQEEQGDILAGNAMRLFRIASI